jgi:hypothetical protein
MSAFHYNPLKRHETRILWLEPGKDDEPLIGTLEVINLNRVSSYSAISYQWGETSRTHSITLSTGTLNITASLYSALRDLRQTPSNSDRASSFWADAICINQDDINERESQVAMMGAIYRQAKTVLTYIGPSVDDSGIGIEFAQDIFDHYFGGNTRIRQGQQIEDIISSNSSTNASIQRRKDAFKTLLLRSWSSRVWCAQEFLLNENLTIFCGTQRVGVTWSVLMDVVQLAFNRSLPYELLPSPDEDPLALKECLAILGHLRRNIIRDKRSFRLASLLSLLHPFSATDPRDKIYSILSLASDRNELAIPIDYTSSAESVYLIVATRIFKQCPPSLELLYDNLGQKTLSLPSWVPDWTTCVFGKHGSITIPFSYQAGGKAEPSLEVKGSILSIKGCLVTQIKEVSEPTGQYYLNLDAKDRGTFLQSESNRIKQLDPYPTGELITEVFWRTLVGNMTLFGEPVPASYRKLFEAHIRYSSQSVPEDNDEANAREFVDAARRRLRYRRLAILDNKYYGAVPDNAQIGDWIVCFWGGRHFFVLREQDRKQYTYIGFAYVHGLMGGEILNKTWLSKMIHSMRFKSLTSDWIHLV